MRLFHPIIFVVGFAGFAAASSGGCGGVALPPGAVDGPVAGAPADKCTQDGEYWIVTAADCGFLNCPDMNAPAYALCDGKTFSACTCTQPAAGDGWMEIPGEGAKDAGNYPDVIGIDGADHHDSGHDAAKDTGAGDAGTEAGGGEAGAGEAGGTGEGGAGG